MTTAKPRNCCFLCRASWWRGPAAATAELLSAANEFMTSVFFCWLHTWAWPWYVHFSAAEARLPRIMSLTVTIELPVELERALRASERDLGVAAKEALAVSLFRQGKLSHAELGGALNLDRFETDALLKRQLVTTGGLTLADLEMDRAVLEDVLGPVRR